MNPTRYRVLLTLLGVALALVVVIAVVITPGGEPTPLPEAIESISPTDGATVLRPTQLVIDMQVDYTIELFVDGTPIPPDEIDFMEATGRHVWTPGDGKVFTDWPVGATSVFISWDRVQGLPDPGEYRWTFRVQ